MCDSDALADFDRALRARGLTRRQFALATSAALLSGCVKAGEGSQSSPAQVENSVTVETPDGQADALFIHPASGRHPGVLMWPDVAGLRPASREMARQLAAQNYAVLLVNPYYRNARAPVLESLADYFEPDARARITPMREALTPQRITSDAKAHVAFLDAQPVVDRARGIGTNGYCMGGPFAVRTAATVPSRVKAVATMHGGPLVTDEPDSPHRVIGATTASFLFAIGQNDDAKAPLDKDKLREAAAMAGRPAIVEVFAADHGWTALDAPVYDVKEAARANEMMYALFARAL